MTFTFPNESKVYRAARNRLLAQEIELRRAMEALAATRRALPPGGEVPADYAFQGLRPDGAPGEVRLSELVAPGKDSLVIYNMMFPRQPTDDRPGPTTGATARLPLSEGPCPSCTALVDQLDGAAPHVEPRVTMRGDACVPRVMLSKARDPCRRKAERNSVQGHGWEYAHIVEPGGIHVHAGDRRHGRCVDRCR